LSYRNKYVFDCVGWLASSPRKPWSFLQSGCKWMRRKTMF